MGGPLLRVTCALICFLGVPEAALQAEALGWALLQLTTILGIPDGRQCVLLIFVFSVTDTIEPLNAYLRNERVTISRNFFSTIPFLLYSFSFYISLFF